MNQIVMHTRGIYGRLPILLNSGCSDNSFADSRSTLISMGKNVYPGVIEDPANLSTVAFYESGCCYEGYAYTISDVLEERMGDLPVSKILIPEMSSGKEWEEDEVDSLLPGLSFLDEEQEETNA